MIGSETTGLPPGRAFSPGYGRAIYGGVIVRLFNHVASGSEFAAAHVPTQKGDCYEIKQLLRVGKRRMLAVSRWTIYRWSRTAG